MLIAQKIFALIVCTLVFGLSIELVRRRRLREEYSVLWLAVSLGMFVLVLRYDWLVGLTELIGAALPTTTLFIGAIIFLLLLAVQFSIKLSEMSGQLKNLAQDNALLRAALEERAGRERQAARGKEAAAGRSGEGGTALPAGRE